MKRQRLDDIPTVDSFKRNCPKCGAHLGNVGDKLQGQHAAEPCLRAINAQLLAVVTMCRNEFAMIEPYLEGPYAKAMKAAKEECDRAIRAATGGE